MKYIVFILLASFMVSCGGNPDDRKKEAAKVEADRSVFKTGSEVLPGLMKTDSLQILYYDDPYGDPKRYSRFFKFVSTSTDSVLHPLLNNLNTNFKLKQQVTQCHSEGKIYLFTNGQPLKTIYFSAKKDSCAYLYFIKDGLFYEFDVLAETATVLDKQRKIAKVPEAEQLNAE
jgi:hypothetical protein